MTREDQASHAQTFSAGKQQTSSSDRPLAGLSQPASAPGEITRGGMVFNGHGLELVNGSGGRRRLIVGDVLEVIVGPRRAAWCTLATVGGQAVVASRGCYESLSGFARRMTHLRAVIRWDRREQQR